MDRLKLIVRHGHPDQRVKVVIRVDEPFPRGQFVEDEISALRRRVDDLVRRRIGDPGAGDGSNSHLPAMKGGADLGGSRGGDGSVLHRLDAGEEGASITQPLLRGVVAAPDLSVFEQGITRRDDVLDLRARLGLQQGEAVEQDTWVWEEPARLRKGGQCGPCFDGHLEDRLGLEVDPLGRQRGQLVVGHLGAPGHRSHLSTRWANTSIIWQKLNTYAVCLTVSRRCRSERLVPTGRR